jgi:hypothetical protein
MSQQLISRNADLQQLRNDGYDIQVKAKGANLVMRGVPYVNSRREVKRGILVSELSLAGDATIKPGNHVIYWAGEFPCNADGTEINKIRHQSQVKELYRDLVVQHSFSSRPEVGYTDHHDKMVTYAAILSVRLTRLILQPRLRPSRSSGRRTTKTPSSITATRLRAARRSPRSPGSWNSRSSPSSAPAALDLTSST